MAQERRGQRSSHTASRTRCGDGLRGSSRRAARWWCAAALALVAIACASKAVPQQPDPRNDLCSSCRMPVSDPRLASQVVAPNEEPRYFDDLRCLRDYLAAQRSLPPGAVAYVADHRTRAWVEAAQAVFASVPALETPMGSHWVAYADEGSLRADPDAAGSSRVSASDIFGPAGPPGS
jgi:copper chaperone NosL